MRRSALRVALFTFALLPGTGLAVAQQLPPAPSPIPQLHRGANGELEAIPAPAPPPAAKPAETEKAPQSNVRPPAVAKAPPHEAAPKAAAPVVAAPAPVVAAPAPAAAPPSAPVATAQAAHPEPPTIALPEPLAIELPPGASTLAPDAPPLRDLLAAAKSGERKVTSDLQHPVGPGPIRVTWTAWSGAPGASAPAATASAVLFVLPPGVTPIGLSGDENATGGNNATKIARNAAGNLVNMVWIDGGRPGKGSAVMYRLAEIAADNSIHLSAPIRVDDAVSEAWNAYPGLAVAGNTVHIAWQAGGHAWYRHLVYDGGVFHWGPIRDVGAPSDGRDVGVSIATEGSLIDIVTPSGIDAVSRDDGTTWRTEKIPLPAGAKIKTISVALDAAGRTHVAFSDAIRGPLAEVHDKGSRGYWELRYIRRNADGTWVDPENILRGRAEWAEPTNDDDALADWARILVDGDIHVTWHGTAISRIYGHDSAFYIRRAADGAGWRDGWDAPQLLVPPDPARGIRYSFAPSLALGRGVAVPVAFYDVYDGERWAGFDAVARVARNGAVAGPPLPVAQWIRAALDVKRPEMALSARFPAAGPRLVYAPDGRVWLDVLETLIPMGVPDAPKLIAYQRIDITRWLGGDAPRRSTVGAVHPASAPSAPAPTEVRDGTVLFTLSDMLSYVANLLDRVRH